MNNIHQQARESFLSEVKRQMIGPFNESESITVAPWDLYHTGMIWPAGSKIQFDECEEEKQEDDDNVEGFMDLVNAARQSAIGFTFFVSDSASSFSLVLEYALYTESITDKETSWCRAPFYHELTVNIEALTYGMHDIILNDDHVVVRARAKKVKDRIALTVTLINQKPITSRYGEGILYQAEMSISAEALISAPVLDHIINHDPEYWQHELLYRASANFATGHGCAVHWAGEHPRYISSCWLPVHEVLKASPEIDDLSDTPLLNMKFIIESDDSTLLEHLALIPDKYHAWIHDQTTRVEEIVNTFSGERRDKIHAVAMQNLHECQKQSDRMVEGIRCLSNSASLMRAFRLANQTIRKSIELSTLRKKGVMNFEPRWRPFQLAFLLLSLPSSIDRDHPDREVMELIWFPTGGGKTEAYLGLTAILMFHRYLTAASPQEAAGTVVMTRYTLRLLTIQQFERAALMICAANMIRGEQADLRSFKAFDIGLFVGGGATPNTLEKASKLLQEQTDDPETTLPVQSCPVCGAMLSTRHQAIRDGVLLTWCSDVSCIHGSPDLPLPLIFVDEQLYASPPTFLIGTVDKFANMPFTPDMARLLGRGTAAAPLQLIIQDELHLISDALGTVTALFETAIDEIASVDGKRVKIIGSTATIRRAEVQIRKLFNRKVMQFPTPCLDADNSFFYQSDKQNPGRLYVGLHAQGRSPKHTLARLTGNCLQAAEYVEKNARDNFYTLVMYFNSLRELGGSLLLLQDDIPRYLEVMRKDENIGRRIITRFTELTSKLSSAEIPQILDDLNERWPANATSQKEPIDAVLATNMISVGVDVSRLGVMVVNGQPKNTAEYIQASSRVGRDTGKAGIVFTLYNWTRPRDRSHYEKFQTFHSAFYRHVESSSVTPFASRARDRALHSILIAMVRLTIPEFADNKSAIRIHEPALRQRVRALIGVICARVKETEAEEADDTRQNLEDILYDWMEKARMTSKLSWTGHHTDSNALLKNKVNGEDPWEMQRSVRDVEAQVKVSMMVQE